MQCIPISNNWKFYIIWVFLHEKCLLHLFELNPIITTICRVCFFIKNIHLFSNVLKNCLAASAVVYHSISCFLIFGRYPGTVAGGACLESRIVRVRSMYSVFKGTKVSRSLVKKQYCGDS